LQQAISKLLTYESLRAELASNCRKVAVEEYSLELQAQRYLALYKQLLP
jgi:glycosyltransferase involved in cell wall biosynthesis